MSTSITRASPASRNGSTKTGSPICTGPDCFRPQSGAVELALDLRVQHVVRDELVAAREKFKAIAAAGIVINVHTGEIVVDGVGA